MKDLWKPCRIVVLAVILTLSVFRASKQPNNAEFRSSELPISFTHLSLEEEDVNNETEDSSFARFLMSQSTTDQEKSDEKATSKYSKSKLKGSSKNALFRRSNMKKKPLEKTLSSKSMPNTEKNNTSRKSFLPHIKQQKSKAASSEMIFIEFPKSNTPSPRSSERFSKPKEGKDLIRKAMARSTGEKKSKSKQPQKTTTHARTQSLSEDNSSNNIKNPLLKWSSSPSMIKSKSKEYLGSSSDPLPREKTVQFADPTFYSGPMRNARLRLENTKLKGKLKKGSSFIDSVSPSGSFRNELWDKIRSQNEDIFEDPECQTFSSIFESVTTAYNSMVSLSKHPISKKEPVLWEFDEKFESTFKEILEKSIFRPILQSNRPTVKLVQLSEFFVAIFRNDDDLLKDMFLSTYGMFLSDKLLYRIVRQFVIVFKKLHPTFPWPAKLFSFIKEWIVMYSSKQKEIQDAFLEDTQILEYGSVAEEFIDAFHQYKYQVDTLVLRNHHPFLRENIKDLLKIHRLIFTMGPVDFAASLHVYQIHVVWCSIDYFDPDQLIIKALQMPDFKGVSNVFRRILQFSKTFSAWIAKVILNEITSERRSVILEFFIRAASHAWTELKNYDVVFLIFLGIKTAESMYYELFSSALKDNFYEKRLFQRPETKYWFDRLIWFTNKDHIFVSYRRTLIEFSRYAIPFFGLLAATIQAIRDEKITLDENFDGNLPETLIKFELIESAYSNILILRNFQVEQPFDDNFRKVASSPLTPYFSKIHYESERENSDWLEELLGSSKLDIKTVKLTK